MAGRSRLSRKLAAAARYASLSVASFVATVAACVFLRPRPALRHLGLSVYGTERATILPYAGGLLLTGYFLAKAAHALPRAPRALRLLSEAVLVLAILVVGVCLTPVSLGAFFHATHLIASAVLFTVELPLAVWMAATLCRRTPGVYALLAAQFTGAGLAMASEVAGLNRMLVGEIAAQLAFGILLALCLRRLSRRPRAPRR